MIYGSGAYKVLLVLHLLSVVVAFGPWFLNGLLPQTALGKPEARAINAANFRVSSLSQYAMYAVFVFGFATLGAANAHVKPSMGEAWVWLSILDWVAIVGVLHGLVLPAQRALKDGQGAPEALTQRQSLGAALINILVIGAIFLMVFEPGH